MKSVLRFIGQALAVGTITLALDFILTAAPFPGLKKSWAEAARPDVYDGFAPFFCDPANVAIARHFIAGDVGRAAISAPGT